MDSIDQLIATCHYLYQKGWATSTSGNLSTRVEDKIYLTATGVSLSNVTRENLAIVDMEGKTIGNAKPTKEVGIHLAIYKKNPNIKAVIHVHPVYTIATSVLMNLEKECYLPALTPQYVMRTGMVPVVAYHPPGTAELARAVENSEALKAIVLQNHGLLTFASDFNSAIGILEETEENCKIKILAGSNAKVLSAEEIKFLLTRKM